MKYDAAKALDIIPKNLLRMVELVNHSIICCDCERRYYMENLTKEVACTCGRQLGYTRDAKIRIMTECPTVREQVQEILKQLGVS